jgi:hypothetical protein
MKGVLNVELAGVVLTLKSITGLLLTGDPPLPPPQADKIRPNSKKPTRIHSPELNEIKTARRIARQRGLGRVIPGDEIKNSKGSGCFSATKSVK